MPTCPSVVLDFPTTMLIAFAVAYLGICFVAGMRALGEGINRRG